MITQRMMSGKKDKICIKFTASDDGNNINFFIASNAITPLFNYNVYINGVLVSQNYDNLTFLENDVITIVAKPGIDKYPMIDIRNINCIKSIDAPLPYMVDYSGNNNFTYRFYGSSIESIPNDMFKYNPNTTSFACCFSNCNSLTTIPKDLFKYNKNVTNFSYCFSNCKSLTTIPKDLFKYNTKVTDFSYCFNNCINITSAVPELWNRDNIAFYTRCFYKCYDALNYASIPSGWK